MSSQQVAAHWRLSYGSQFVRGEGVRFRVWAPRVRRPAIHLTSNSPARVEMQECGDGEFELLLPKVEPGADYFIEAGPDRRRPDPVSRFQPAGVHGPSRVVDPDSFVWTDQQWTGLPLRNFLLYELHVGTFTAEGTFETVIARLPYLRDIGITAISLMPSIEFPGARNWGYDGVNLYAPHSAYGGPDGLKRLVDASHREGLAVVLDVVYNHIGPEGNYLSEFGPYFTDAYRTPWGQAINLDSADSDHVRRYFIDNALYWLTEYHVDGLRLDATHAMFDFGAHHFLLELSQAFHEQAACVGRRAYLIAESDRNDVRLLRPAALGGYELDAQWSDDFHHSVNTVLVGERHGYLQDFGKIADIAKALQEGYVYDGRRSAYRRRRHGSSAKERPGEQFVVYLQSHDQIANARGGKRLSALVQPGAARLAVGLMLASANVPMLFMGEEYAEDRPFHYFTSHTDEALATAVREGRRMEFASFFEGRPFADPQSPATFEESKLDWSTIKSGEHAAMLRWYRDLIRLRKRVASLSNCRMDLLRADFDEDRKWLVMERRDDGASRALLCFNLSGQQQRVSISSRASWSLALWSGDAAYRTPGEDQPVPTPAKAIEAGHSLDLAPYAALVYLSEEEVQRHGLPSH